MSIPAVQIITLLIIGFSVCAAVILLPAYLFFLLNMRKTIAGKFACASLLLALSGLQLYHFGYLLLGIGDLFDHRAYVLLLLIAPPTFYFFSRELLLPDPGWSVWQLLHVIPVALGFFLPVGVVVPIAFAIGAAYAVWFARVAYGMRRHIGRFQFEMFFFGLFAVLAVLILILFILVPYIDASTFYIAYANFTGAALLLIVAALIVFPEMLDDITDVASDAYANSTLNDVDVTAMVGRLEQAISGDKLYENEDLNLKMLADTVGLSGHQLSELINTHFGMGFSRLVRERRIAEAKRLLSQDKNISILSISMATGFRSQSNFYAAFRDNTGMSPGKYRESPD
jgi:AraC-like DNA-binding protein